MTNPTSFGARFDPWLSNAGLLLLRTVPSCIMMTHGWPKLQRLLDQWGTEEGVKFYDFMGLGPEVSLILTVLGELVAPALMVVGFQSQAACRSVHHGVAAFWSAAIPGRHELPCCTSCAFCGSSSRGWTGASTVGARSGRRLVEPTHAEKRYISVMSRLTFIVH